MGKPGAGPQRGSRPRGATWAAFAAVLALFCAGCPQMLVAKGVSTAAGIVADDRSLSEQTADFELKSQIEQGLLTQSAALAARVNVDVFLGRVMLTGVVAAADSRWMAVRTARQIAGDREVYDDIEVRPDGSLTDAAANTAANKALGLNLLASEGIASQSLLHRVVEGTAFIMGEVQDANLIEAIRAVALQTPGVGRVVTHITLVE